MRVDIMELKILTPVTETRTFLMQQIRKNNTIILISTERKKQLKKVI